MSRQLVGSDSIALTSVLAVLSFLRRQWFLFGLALVLAAGLLVPHAQPLVWLADADQLRNAIVATVLLMTALALNTRSITDAIRRPTAVAWSVTVNSGLLPLVAWLCAYFFSHELAVGLMATAAAPCTIASAAVWTRRAGGNDAIAILVTVITNASCFLITPMWMQLTIGATGESKSAAEMILNLFLTVLLPMMVGQSLRISSTIAGWSHDHRPLLGTLSQLGILIVVLMGATTCGQRLAVMDWQSGPSGAGEIGAMLVTVAILHAFILFVAQRVGAMLGLSRAEWIAAGFAGSQKTLMVGLTVALSLGGGLAVLPMVAYHVLQLIIDTVVADRLAAKPLASTNQNG